MTHQSAKTDRLARFVTEIRFSSWLYQKYRFCTASGEICMERIQKTWNTKSSLFTSKLLVVKRIGDKF